MFRKALSRVVVVTGDLHGCFHALMVVYSLFYVAIIQPIQTLLKWKQIVGSDITKCYQQAAGLALMVSDETEQHLVSHCIAQLENNKPVLDQIKTVKDSPNEVAVILAKHYLEWIESQRKKMCGIHYQKRNEREVQQLLMKEGVFDIDGFAEAIFGMSQM